MKSRITENAIHPYSIAYKKTTRFLLWESIGEGRDRFVLDADGNLIWAVTAKKLKGLAGRMGFEVDWDQAFHMDYDRFWALVRSLQPGRKSSENDCAILLSGWNGLEDMARTFGFFRELIKWRTNLGRGVYDKLYWGNHLSAPAPEGKSLQPAWTKKEIRDLSTFFSLIWNQVWKGMPFDR